MMALIRQVLRELDPHYYDLTPAQQKERHRPWWPQMAEASGPVTWSEGE